MSATVFDLAQQYTTLRRASSRGEYHGPCPGCGGKDRLSVHTDTDRWYCRQCGRQGDAIQFLREFAGMSFQEAREQVTGAVVGAGMRAMVQQDDAPAADWRARAERVITEWEAQLWAEGGTRALAWLHARALTDETIRAARLGYCPADGKIGAWRVARGITIPLIGVDGALYGVRIRRPVPQDARSVGRKYVSLTGGRKCLYGRTQRHATLLVVEGELDCLLAQQELRDAADVATICLGNPDGRWQWHLVGIPHILVCLDADPAGQQGWARWQGSGNARQVHLPAGKDISQAVVDHGLDLRAWLAEQMTPARSVVAMAPEVHEPAPEICPPEARWTVADDPWMAGSEEGF